MKKSRNCIEAAGFFGLALVAAHVVALFANSMRGLYAYPVAWLLLIAVFAIDTVEGRPAKGAVTLAAGFFGLALVAAHVVSWLTGGAGGLFAYPAVWLLLIVILGFADHSSQIQHTSHAKNSSI